MAFGVCAYPELKEKDIKIIRNFRKENDELYYSIAKPHFAFVFPVDEPDISQEQFIDEIYHQTKGSESIEFDIKCATVNKDAFLPYYHLLLVPDKGFHKIVKLHDRLYSNLLFPYLRLDIDFIPHMGIANAKDKFEVKKWADQWNKKDFSINGVIHSLTIVDYSRNILTDIEQISLT
ncbi:MAG: 2'-5' RNA ligase family protein [Bacteroidales bacterium]|jgi:hypothetical protein|nr:2'-5' RNA ligase family protein [Bacteroidales bacterium]